MQELLGRLQQLRELCRDQLAGMDNVTARAQPHPDLSPMAWHVGHCFYTESFWLQERLLNRPDGSSADWRDLYVPEYCDKQSRGQRLPDVSALLAWSRQTENANMQAWLQAACSDHALMRDHYLPLFLIQHYAQHLETMQMLRQQLAAQQTAQDTATLSADAAQWQAPTFTQLPGGAVPIGSPGDPAAYDNELQAQTVELAACRLAVFPITCAQWLAFMLDGGYSREEFWCDAGWRWLTASRARHPQHWCRQGDGAWQSADPQEPLAAQAPVHGICWYEASAFARWAGYRLPHEYELEHAFRQRMLTGRGSVWEWCANPLHPYPGFRAFPYDGYSAPWFDGQHRVLRGGSRHTQPELRRAGFRNFYPEGHRHVFAGLRLAADI